MSGTYSLPYTIKAEWTAYLIFSIICGPFILLALWRANTDTSWVSPTIVFFFIWVLAMFWIYSFKIKILEDKIVYKTLFARIKEVLFLNISKIDIKIGMNRDGRNKGYYRFNIHQNLSEEPIIINIKPFSQRDLAVLTDVICTKVPSVIMDDLTHELKDGNFKPIISAGVKKMWQIALVIFIAFLVVAIIKILIK